MCVASPLSSLFKPPVAAWVLERYGANLIFDSSIISNLTTLLQTHHENYLSEAS